MFQNLTFEFDCEQNYGRKAGKGGAGDHSSHSQSLLPGGKARQKYLWDVCQTSVIGFDMKTLQVKNKLGAVEINSDVEENNITGDLENLGRNIQRASC